MLVFVFLDLPEAAASTEVEDKTFVEDMDIEEIRVVAVGSIVAMVGVVAKVLKALHKPIHPKSF